MAGDHHSRRRVAPFTDAASSEGSRNWRFDCAGCGQGPPPPLAMRSALLHQLQTAGWLVEPAVSPVLIDDAILQRYPWMPPEFRELAESATVLAAPGEQSWLLTSSDFNGSSASAFVWDEWERLSLAATDDDARLASSVR